MTVTITPINYTSPSGDYIAPTAWAWLVGGGIVLVGVVLVWKRKK